MTGIDDVAASGGPEIVVTSDLPERPPAELTDEVKQADELTDEGQFPKFGRFVRVKVDDGQEWWELAQGLAQAIVEIAEERDEEYQGQFLDVVSAHKSASGEWRFQVQMQSDRDELL